MTSKHINDPLKYINDPIPTLFNEGIVKTETQPNDIPPDDWYVRIVPNVAMNAKEMLDAQSELQKKSVANEYASFLQSKNDIKYQTSQFQKIIDKQEIEEQKAKLAELNARLNNVLFTSYLEELRSKIETYEANKIKAYEEQVKKANEAIEKSKLITQQVISPAPIPQQEIEEINEIVESEIIDDIEAEPLETTIEGEISEEIQEEQPSFTEPIVPEEATHEDIVEIMSIKSRIAVETLDSLLQMEFSLIPVKDGEPSDPDVPTTSYLFPPDVLKKQEETTLKIFKEIINNRRDIFAPKYTIAPYTQTPYGIKTLPSSDSTLSSNPLYITEPALRRIVNDKATDEYKTTQLNKKINLYLKAIENNRDQLIDASYKIDKLSKTEKEIEYNKLLKELRLLPQGNIGMAGKPIWYKIPYDIADNQLELLIKRYDIVAERVKMMKQEDIKNPLQLANTFLSQIVKATEGFFKIVNFPEYFEGTYKLDNNFLKNYREQEYPEEIKPPKGQPKSTQKRPVKVVKLVRKD